MQSHRQEIDEMKSEAAKLNRQVRAAFDVVKAEFTTIQEGIDAEQDAKISKLQNQVDILKA